MFFKLTVKSVSSTVLHFRSTNLYVLSIVCKKGSSEAYLFQVEVFWVVTPCYVVVGYQRFGGPCCLHLQGDVIGGEERNCIDTGLYLQGSTTQKTSELNFHRRENLKSNIRYLFCIINFIFIAINLLTIIIIVLVHNIT
jgi:hypothetical protein